MKTRNTLMATVTAAALAIAFASPTFAAEDKTDTNSSEWTCPRYEQMQKFGYGPGNGMGYGRHHRGGGMGGGMGLMGGGPRWDFDKDLSVEQVKDIIEGKIAFHGNDNLKVGKIEAKDDDTVIAEIVTKDGSLVQKVAVNRDTGRMRPTK